MFLHAFETVAVDGCAPEFTDGCLVGLGRIAFVLGKTIFRIILVIERHYVVSGYLGDNGGRSNGYAPGVALRYGFLGKI